MVSQARHPYGGTGANIGRNQRSKKQPGAKVSAAYKKVGSTFYVLANPIPQQNQ